MGNKCDFKYNANAIMFVVCVSLIKLNVIRAVTAVTIHLKHTDTHTSIFEISSNRWIKFQ